MIIVEEEEYLYIISDDVRESTLVLKEITACRFIEISMCKLVLHLSENKPVKETSSDPC